MNPLYQRAAYLLSVHQLKQLPPDQGREVAFAGRSNSGKSSAINTLTGQRQLARTSKTPGRTQQIIFFRLDDTRHLVDLPGYGYAKVPPKLQAHWEQTLESYLRQRRSLKGLVLVMDIRHPLTRYDEQMLDWCAASEMPVHALLTKADKLSRGKARATLQQVSHLLRKNWGEHADAQIYSASTGVGVEALQARLDDWLLIDH